MWALISAYPRNNLPKKPELYYSPFIKIESGLNKNPTLETLRKIANAFKIKIDELVGGDS